MTSQTKPITILCADDDPDDRMLLQQLFESLRLINDVRFVNDGEEVLDYLMHRGKYRDPMTSPKPGLILLDLNMPRRDGREALKVIKSDPYLHIIPVVLLTGSQAEEDQARCFVLGASSFLRKPVTLKSLVEMVRTVGSFWTQLVAVNPVDRL